MQDMLSYSGYTLVFEDHFDGSELDRGCWNVELHEPGWVNEEFQAYVDRPETMSPWRTSTGSIPPDGMPPGTSPV